MILTMSASALVAWLWPIVIFLAVCAILWWAVEKFTLPQPIRIGVIVLAVIVGIYFLISLGPPPG